MKRIRLSYIFVWAIIACVITWDGIVSISNGKTKSHSIGLLAAFYVISIVWFWSYWVACWGDPGSLETFYRECGVLEMIQSGNIPPELTSLPVCNKCHLPKPDRAHHCSTCNQCYFRFDHHCPVIGNCVALWNYKGFLMMPIYGGVLMILMGLELGVHRGYEFAIVSLPFVLFFWGFAFSYCKLITQNLTTLESNYTGYNRGNHDKPWENFTEIFDSLWGLFLPTRPKISGFYWQNVDLPAQINSMIQRIRALPLTEETPLVECEAHEEI